MSTYDASRVLIARCRNVQLRHSSTRILSRLSPLPSRAPGGTSQDPASVTATDGGHLMTKVAINGLGRIGRATLKIVMDTPGLDLVAANDIGAPDNVEYLLKYDTVYGRYDKAVEATDDGYLKVGDRRLKLLSEKDAASLPW